MQGHAVGLSPVTPAILCDKSELVEEIVPLGSFQPSTLPDGICIISSTHVGEEDVCQSTPVGQKLVEKHDSPSISVSRVRVGIGKLLSYSRRAKGVLKELLLPLPDVQHTHDKQPVAFTPRRSKRLAASSRKIESAEERFQGSGSDHRTVLQNFLKLFDKQLSRDHIMALAALFKIPVPEFLPRGIEGPGEVVLSAEPLAAT